MFFHARLCQGAGFERVDVDEVDLFLGTELELEDGDAAVSREI